MKKDWGIEFEKPTMQIKQIYTIIFECFQNVAEELNRIDPDNKVLSEARKTMIGVAVSLGIPEEECRGEE